MQRELADLKAEITLIRQAAQGTPAPAATLALAAPVEPQTAASRSTPARHAPPPPPPPAPPLHQPAQSQTAPSTPTAEVVASVSNTPADLDGKTDLMAAIRAAGGSLRKASLKTSRVPTDGGNNETPKKLNDGRPDMCAIVPSTPPTLRKAAAHSPGGTPQATQRALHPFVYPQALAFHSMHAVICEQDRQLRTTRKLRYRSF